MRSARMEGCGTKEFSILQPLKKQNVKIVLISLSNHRFSPRVLCKYKEPNWIDNSLQKERLFWGVFWMQIIFPFEFSFQAKVIIIFGPKLEIMFYYMYKCIFGKINQIKRKFIDIVHFVVHFCCPGALLVLLLLLFLLLLMMM